MIPAFSIKTKGRNYDYRLGNQLNLDDIKNFFQAKNFTVEKLSFTGRHIIGRLKDKNNRLMFLKLATSYGMSIVTENEYQWNNQTSGILPVPINYYSGYFEKDYFYFIVSYFDGRLLDKNLLKRNIDKVINLAETIKGLKLNALPADKYNPGKNHQEKFFNKTYLHFQSVPKKISENYNLNELLDLIKANLSDLASSPHHGDFAPWHMIMSLDGKINLIDGEHAMSKGVEYYDLGYFIQRVYSVWKEKELAEIILEKLYQRGYEKNKLKTILSARAIGGFLDESFSSNPDYSVHENFKDWVLHL